MNYSSVLYAKLRILNAKKKNEEYLSTNVTLTCPTFIKKLRKEIIKLFLSLLDDFFKSSFYLEN